VNARNLMRDAVTVQNFTAGYCKVVFIKHQARDCNVITHVFITDPCHATLAFRAISARHEDLTVQTFYF